MIRATSAALLVLLVSVTGVVLWLGYDAHRLLKHLDGAALRAQGLETKANATLINLDKGTAVWAASAKDQAGAIADLATDAHGTLSQADNALVSIKQSSDRLSDELVSLKGTTDASTVFIQSTSQDLHSTFGVVQAGLPPLFGKSGAALDNVNAFLKKKAIDDILTNTASITGSGADIMSDARRVTAKETADWLRPVPWWKKPIKRGGQIIDIVAAAARHTP
jgi:hypothetical protein